MIDKPLVPLQGDNGDSWSHKENSTQSWWTLTHLTPLFTLVFAAPNHNIIMDVLASISDFSNTPSLSSDPQSCTMPNGDPILVDTEYDMGEYTQGGFCIII